MTRCSNRSARDDARCELAAGHVGPHECAAVRADGTPAKPRRWVTTAEWRSATQAQRRRKPVTMTLSDEARQRLAEMARKHPDGTQSAVVEDLIAVVGDLILAAKGS